MKRVAGNGSLWSVGAQKQRMGPLDGRGEKLAVLGIQVPEKDGGLRWLFPFPGRDLNMGTGEFGPDGEDLDHSGITIRMVHMYQETHKSIHLPPFIAC